MTASYPGSVKVFTTKSNVTDTVDASHPNSVQEEVVAIETILGASPNQSSAANSSGTFNAASTAFGTVTARIANIETGVVADSHTQYIRKTADSNNTIIPTNINTNGLVIKGLGSQSAALQEWRSEINQVLAAVTPTGLYTGTISASNVIGSISAVPIDNTVEQKAESFSITTIDKNKVFYCVNTSATVTVTVPLNASQAFPLGSQIHFVRGAAGAVVFQGVSGSVSVNASPGAKLRATWSAATLMKLAENTWVLLGDLSA